MTQECTVARLTPPPPQYLTGFKLFARTVLKTIGGRPPSLAPPPWLRPGFYQGCLQCDEENTEQNFVS